MTATKKTTTGTVYVLIDPRDDRVRYVGATTKTLKARLKGHRTRAAARVKAWIDELATEGLTPRIEPVNEGVPESQLRDCEREEITRRVIAGEALLNESATAQGRRRAEQQRKEERIERERAAWKHAANQVRSILGGPLPPGDVPPIPLGARAMANYHSILRIRQDADREHAASDSRLWIARADAADDLWRSVQPIWARLLSRAGQHFEDVLASRVGTVFTESWTDLQDASRYLALLPWGIMAVSPWAALAERAGMDAAGPDFIGWVSDDDGVREALHVLLVRPGGRMGPLSVLDDLDNLSRPSTGLVAMAAAHYPKFRLPQALNMQVVAFLERMLRNGQLTSAMGDLLCKLDPHALDRLLGPDIAADADAQLNLTPGTSRDVLAAVLEKSTALDMDRLERIVSRARGAFPAVQTPGFRELSGNTVPTFQTVTVSLVASGLLSPPPGKTFTGLVGEVQALWRGDRDRLERTA